MRFEATEEANVRKGKRGKKRSIWVKYSFSLPQASTWNRPKPVGRRELNNA
jgi:hypothetical protein